MIARRQGFSLIELLVVIVISVMAVSLAGPRLIGTLERMELKLLTQKVVTSLKASRALAISKQQDSIWLLDVKEQYFQYGRHNKQQSFSDNIKVQLTTASRQQQSDTRAGIRFFPDGSATGGEITLSQGKRTNIIQVDWLTGRVKTL